MRPASAHESPFFVQRPECTGRALKSRAPGGSSGNRPVTSISTGQFRATGATARTGGRRAGGSARLFGHRVITTRRPVESGADDRSTFVGCSDATFLVPAAGRECRPTRNPILAAGWSAAADGPSDRVVARDG